MRNNKIVLYLSLAFLVISAIACKKRVDVEIPPTFAEIAKQETAASFYVFATAPGDIYKIPIGLTSSTNKDVTVKFSYSSATAVAGTHYNAPQSLTIKAGDVIDTLTITGIFANIAPGVAHNVVIKIDNASDVPALTGRDSIVLTLRRYCPVVLSNLAGDYNVQEFSQYPANNPSAPYVGTVTNVQAVAGNPNQATGTITNVWGSNINANVLFDWTDPSNFKVTMTPPTQQTQFTYQGAPTFIIFDAGTVNTFSSCENKIVVNFRFYTAAGIFDRWRATMTKL